MSKLSIDANVGAAVQIGCSAYLASGSKNPKVTDLYAPRIRAWSLNKSELRGLQQDSFLFIDKMVKTHNNFSLGAEKLIPPSLEEGDENQISWYIFGSVCTVGFVVLLVVGLRLYYRLTPGLQPNPTANPEIVVMHQHPLEEQVVQSENLLRDLRELIAMKPIHISNDSFSSVENDSSSSVKTGASTFLAPSLPPMDHRASL